jgi:hypothetical protein
MIGKLENVDLREVWEHEAKDFTTWLSRNLEILGEQIGIDLSFVEREKSAGTFSVDILAEDRDGRHVVIENQLGKTDHDHLGKVLTYVANLEAKTAIWIASEPKPEHIASINYLNEISPDDTGFFLIKVRAFKIGDSEPAPLFTVVAGDEPEIKERGKRKKEIAERDQLRYEFFSKLLEISNERTKLFENVSPLYQSWIIAGAGKFGLGWQYVVKLNNARVELFLAGSSKDQNESRLKFLYGKKDEIEKIFGSELEWDFSEDRKQQYIRSTSNIGGLLDEEKWPQIHQDLVGKMIRLEKALSPYIKILE